MKVTVHEARMVSSLYVFSDSCTYDQRSEPLCIMDVIYTHEGERAYLSGLRGKFTRQVFRELARHIARTGCVRVEYEKDGVQKVVDLI